MSKEETLHTVRLATQEVQDFLENRGGFLSKFIKFRPKKALFELQKHAPKLRQWKLNGNSEEKLFSEKALKVIEQYNTEEKQTIVLSAPVSDTFFEGALPLEMGEKVDPESGEKDLFRMRAIQVLKEKAGLSPKEILGLTQSSIDAFNLDGRKICLKQDYVTFPGETVQVSLNFDRGKFSLPRELFVGIKSTQTGFPDPLFCFGFALPEAILPPFPADSRKCPKYWKILQRKESLAKELLPKGEKNLMAKRLLSDEREAFQKEADLYVEGISNLLSKILDLDLLPLLKSGDDHPLKTSSLRLLEDGGKISSLRLLEQNHLHEGGSRLREDGSRLREDGLKNHLRGDGSHLHEDESRLHVVDDPKSHLHGDGNHPLLGGSHLHVGDLKNHPLLDGSHLHVDGSRLRVVDDHHLHGDGNHLRVVDDLRSRLLSGHSILGGRKNHLLFDLLSEPFRKNQSLFDGWRKAIDEADPKNLSILEKTLEETAPLHESLSPLEHALYSQMAPLFRNLVLAFYPLQTDEVRPLLSGKAVSLLGVALCQQILFLHRLEGKKISPDKAFSLLQNVARVNRLPHGEVRFPQTDDPLLLQIQETLQELLRFH